MEKILVVDDERNILLLLNKFLKQEGFHVETARSFDEAISRLADSFDLVITDMRLPGRSGLDLLRWIKERRPELPVIVITAYGSIENAVEAMKIGATNYLTKPIEHDEMLAIIRHALIRGRVEERSRLWHQQGQYGIIGKSMAIREVLTTIDAVSSSRANVLITGESGTGKELVAKAIHNVSERRGFPFVAINCAAIPRELIENELFGHEAGSYTGAASREIGKVEMADRGTIFLDEIGEMPPAMQVKLLRFIQEKEFYRIGGTRPIKADCRIVAATNRDLEKEIEAGRFREDLYYRLNVISIHMPHLRERKEDIPLLVDHFIKKYALENQKLIKGIDDMAMDALLGYDWPGNIRELENIIERAIVLTKQEVIALNDLPGKIINKGAGDALRGITDLLGLKLDELERAVVLKALEEEKWNQTRAAARLGITRRQLRLRMVKHRLI